VDLGAFGGCEVAGAAVGVLDQVDRRGAFEGGDLVDVVGGVLGGDAGGPVDQVRFRDAVADEGRDAGDAAPVELVAVPASPLVSAESCAHGCLRISSMNRRWSAAWARRSMRRSSWRRSTS